MKILVAVLVTLLALNATAQIDGEKARQMAKMMLEDCKAQEGGSDADVEKLMNLKYPDTETGKCMIACAHEKMGIFTDGVFNRDLFLVITQQIVENDPVYMEVATAVANKCDKIGGSRCDQALDFDKCIEAEMKAKNLPTKFI